MDRSEHECCRRARQEAQQATENIGKIAAEMSAHGITLRRIDRRTNWQKWAQIVLGAMVPIAVAYITYRAATDRAETIRVAIEKCEMRAELIAKSHEKSTEAISLESAARGAELGVNRYVASRNPAPIATEPPKIEARLHLPANTGN